MAFSVFLPLNVCECRATLEERSVRISAGNFFFFFFQTSPPIGIPSCSENPAKFSSTNAALVLETGKATVFPMDSFYQPTDHVILTAANRCPVLVASEH